MVKISPETVFKKKSFEREQLDVFLLNRKIMNGVLFIEPKFFIGTELFVEKMPKDFRRKKSLANLKRARELVNGLL